MVALPFLASSHIDHEPHGAIMLGKSPERDRDIEQIQKMIAACARAGIPAFKYNMSLLGGLAQRDDTRPGRFTLQHVAAGRCPRATASDPGRKGHGRCRLGADHLLPRPDHSGLQRIQGPSRLPSPRSGRADTRASRASFACWERPEGLRKFVSIQESPYHGLNLCLGTTAEMLQDPRREIHDIIREFGRRKKIFNIHFRNIRGKPRRLPGGLPRRRRHGHAPGGADAPRSRLRIHADA